MSSDAERTMLAEVLQDLAVEARSRRASLPFESEERQFYLGVQTAAVAGQHPQTTGSRPEDWLDHETHAFRNGFLTTSALIAGVLSGSRIPLRIALPLPD